MCTYSLHHALCMHVCSCTETDSFTEVFDKVTLTLFPIWRKTRLLDFLNPYGKSLLPLLLVETEQQLCVRLCQATTQCLCTHVCMHHLSNGGIPSMSSNSCTSKQLFAVRAPSSFVRAQPIWFALQPSLSYHIPHPSIQISITQDHKHCTTRARWLRTEGLHVCLQCTEG